MDVYGMWFMNKAKYFWADRQVLGTSVLDTDHPSLYYFLTLLSSTAVIGGTVNKPLITIFAVDLTLPIVCPLTTASSS